MFPLVGHLSVSFQWRKGSYAGKVLILRRGARIVDLSAIVIVFGEVHVIHTLHWTEKWEQT